MRYSEDTPVWNGKRFSLLNRAERKEYQQSKVARHSIMEKIRNKGKTNGKKTSRHDA
jgi:hypothetical protein